MALRAIFAAALLAVPREAAGQQGTGTCFDTLTFRIRNEDSLRYFSTALTDLGLAESLDGPGPYLVFAPTDSAFEALKDSKSDLLNIELLELIEYHLAATGGYDRYRMKERYGKLEIDTLCSDCRVSVEEDSRGRIKVNSRARVRETIRACNGLLVILDEILVPRQVPSQSPAGRVECDLDDPTCCDIPVPGDFTCAEQKVFGKCDEDFILEDGYCRYTCGRCLKKDEEEAKEHKDCDYSFKHEVGRRRRGAARRRNDKKRTKKKVMKGKVRKRFGKL